MVPWRLRSRFNRDLSQLRYKIAWHDFLSRQKSKEIGMSRQGNIQAIKHESGSNSRAWDLFKKG
jgi:hypothetical protein